MALQAKAQVDLDQDELDERMVLDGLVSCDVQEIFEHHPEVLDEILGTILKEGLSPEQALGLVGVPTFGEWLCGLGEPGWRWDWPYLKWLQHQLDRITVGNLNRLMVLMPPRHGKSEQVTVRYPVYRMEQSPGFRAIVASYNGQMASKFSGKSKKVARARLGFGALDQAIDWDVSNGSSYYGVGIGGGVTGRGGDLLILDDPVKSREEAESLTFRDKTWKWYTDTFKTRLEPGGAMIIILTRWHEDDIAGRILRDPELARDFEVVSFPALAEEADPLGRAIDEPLCPERYPFEELDKIRRQDGEYKWWSLYQQQPRPAGGAVYMRDWWAGRNRFDPQDGGFWNRNKVRFLSFDTAMKDTPEAAYTACVVAELTPDYRLALREVMRKKCTYPELMRTVRSYAEHWNHDGKLHSVVIEDAASGTSALQDLRESSPAWLARKLAGFQLDSGKVGRAQEAAIRCQNGSVLLPHPDNSVPWLFDFEQEVFSFPQSAFKDQTDAFTQVVLYTKHLLLEGEAHRFAQDVSA